LPGEVFAHPIYADVLRSPVSPSTLPHHGTAIHLGVKWGLVTTSHHHPLSIVLSATKSPVEPCSAAVGTVVVGRAGVVEFPCRTGYPVQVVAILLSKKGQCYTLRRAVGATSLCSDSDRLDENLSGRVLAYMIILARVPIRAVGICDTSWLAFPALTVEAGCVWGVFNVTDVGNTLVAERIVSASLHRFTLVVLAIRASFAVGVVNTSWRAQMVICTVVAGGWVFLCIAGTIPVRANLMAHAAVFCCLAGATSCVAGEAGGALVV